MSAASKLRIVRVDRLDIDSGKPIEGSFKMKLERLNDKLVGLRKEKREVIKILNKIKDLE